VPVKYTLLIFDLDDTLFDYKATETRAVITACQALGIRSTDDLYTQYRRAHQMVRVRYEILTPQNIASLRKERAEVFLSLIHSVHVSANDFIEEYLRCSTCGVIIEGVPETLDRLQGVRKVVATNGTNYPRRDKLYTSAIAKHFDAYFSAEDVGMPKSDPKFFEAILSRCHVGRNDVLIIGDDYDTDIRSALLLGIDSCWFNYRHRKPPFPVPRNVSIITGFLQLTTLLT